jgi:dTDP-4-dehydrorhamnose reductase
MSHQILITGSSGFLGRYLIKYAPLENDTIIAQYRQKQPESYGAEVKFLPLDFMQDEWEIPAQFQPDFIVHTAAIASLDECEIKPDICQLMNVEATKKMVDFAASHECRFIFISTDVVFDGKKGNYAEFHEPNPINVYSRSKFEGEQYVLQNHPDAVVVRPALFYGLALNGRPSFTETMLKNLYAGKQVFLFTDQIRTPILVNDLAKAIWELIRLDFKGAIHLGGPQRVSRFEMGEILCDVFKLDRSLLIPMKSEDAKLVALRPPDCTLDSSLAKKILNTPFVECRTGFNMAYR